MKYLHPVAGLSSLILGFLVAASSARGAAVPALRAPGGGSDYAEVANSATVRLNGAMTLEAWVYPTGWRSYTGREKHGVNIMYKGQIGSHIDYVFALQEDGIPCLGNTWGYIGVLNRRVPLNQWTHLAVSVNESTGSFVFYINGVNCGGGSGWQGASLNRTSFLDPSGYPLYVGGFYQLGWGYNNDNFIGKLADVRMWNVVRTPTEIAANYQKQLRGVEPGLAAYWNFADRLDKSPNGNHMTLKGGASFQAGQGPDLQGAGGIDVALTSPANNQIVARGSDLGLAATATSTASVSRVDFYANGTLLSGDASAPFTATWTNVPAGINTLSARATNVAGQVGISADVLIRVHGPFGGAPAEVPGHVEAEKFDLGGQDLGYNEATAANEGGQFRAADGVDIAADAGASNGFVVGWTKANEWMSYVLNVASAGPYTIRTRAAGVGAGGQFRILINGVDKTGPLSVPDTKAWNAYQWVARDGVVLPQGVCTMRVVMVANGPSGNVGAFDTFMIGEALPPVQETYPLVIPVVPGTVVQCENFDRGGEGLAYHEITAANEGGQYRVQDGVDIAQDAGAGNGHVVGWTQAGEWMEYTVNLGTPGSYAIETRVAGLGSGGQFRVLVDDQDATGTLNVPNTGAWNAYQVVTSATANIVALGVHTVRVSMVQNGSSGNVGAFDWFQIAAGAGGPVQLPCDGVPVDLPGAVQAEKFDAGGQGLACSDTTPANEGGQYRVAEAVDIAAHAGASNGYVVGWTKAGEWLEYTVNVTAAGKYNLLARLGALGTGGRFRVEVAGATRDVVVPNTGGWYAYQNVAVNGMELASGIHTMRVSMVQSGSGGSVAALDQFAFSSSGQSAYPAGAEWPVPGRIEVENFDIGGPDVAYGDVSAANEGGQYRATGVDISRDTGASNGYVVGWTKAGEWLEYTVDVEASGTYTLETRVAGLGTGGQFRIWVGGVDQTGVLNVPNTGAWTSYQVVQKTGAALSAGIQRIRLEMVATGASGHVGAFDSLLVRSEVGRQAVSTTRSVVEIPVPLEVRASQEEQQPGAGWLAADGDADTFWQGVPGAGGWWLALAYESTLDLNGLTVDWAEAPADMVVLHSMDAIDWAELKLPLTNGPIPLNYLWLVFPDEGAGAPAIREVNVE